MIVNSMPTQTPSATATPTNAGLAARVNGQPITLAEFNIEMARYLAADPASPDPRSAEGKQLAAQMQDSVLSALIDRVVIAQEAERNRIAVTDKQVDDEISTLVQLRGGRDPYNRWLAQNKLSESDLRDIVRNELLADMMRDRIVEQLPRTAEYVHAYHIVVATQAEAQQALTRLKSGAKFTALAQSISIDDSTRADGGDLGWFARGTGAVVWSEVEDAAFRLQPGQLSPVVHSPIGYHIIKVVDRQTMALTPDDMAHIQQAALEQWMNRLISNSKIEKFL